MEKLRLVLVGTEGAYNLGVISRLAMNFDVDELYLVSPKASIEEAERYAARAVSMLRSARIVDTLDEALEGASLSICTSSVYRDDKAIRIPVPPREAAGLAAASPGTVALVMGRESVGLTRRELEKCSLFSTIPTSSRYPEMNLATATAVYLYELYQARGGRLEVEMLDPEKARLIEMYTRALVEALEVEERRAREIIVSLRRIAVKGYGTRREVEHLLYLLSKACRRVGCRVEAPTDM